MGKTYSTEALLFYSFKPSNIFNSYLGRAGDVPAQGRKPEEPGLHSISILAREGDRPANIVSYRAMGDNKCHF
jgi:hypothetical protein